MPVSSLPSVFFWRVFIPVIVVLGQSSLIGANCKQRGVGGGLERPHRIVRWCVAAPARNESNNIAFAHMTHTMNDRVLLFRISEFFCRFLSFALFDNVVRFVK